MAKEGPTTDALRAEALRKTIQNLQEGLREPIADLYGIHPSDLGTE